MPDLHYEEPSLAELYDLDSGWSVDRDFYLALAGAAPQRILDLGCGTGLLCDAYAALGHSVTGADPAKAMLDVARQKPNGEKIEWVLSSAQDFRSPKRFDLIIMTGHAFQVFLEASDVLATFATMRQHLAPGGLIVFESRNPAIDWPARWNGESDLTTGGQTVRQSRQVTKIAGNPHCVRDPLCADRAHAGVIQRAVVPLANGYRRPLESFGAAGGTGLRRLAGTAVRRRRFG